MNYELFPNENLKLFFNYSLAEEFDVHNEVIQVIWKLPDRKYNSANDAIKALENTYRMIRNRSKV